MQHRQVHHGGRSGGLGVDEPPRPGRGPIAAVRRFFSDRFGRGRATEGGLGPSGSPTPAPVVPQYLAAAPPPPTTASALFDTRLAREIRSLLSGLGASRGAVAGALEAAGVRAAPGDPARSPVALFLAAVVGADPDVKTVRVGSGAAVVDLRAWWRPTVTVALPAVVEDFTTAFDAGCYPALLRGGCRTDGVDRGRSGDPRRAE